MSLVLCHAESVPKNLNVEKRQRRVAYQPGAGAERAAPGCRSANYPSAESAKYRDKSAKFCAALSELLGEIESDNFSVTEDKSPS